MSNRKNWGFAYTADVLLAAARGKHQHHTGRLHWWEAKKAEIMDLIRSEGLEIDEGIDGVKFSSYDRTPQVTVRDDLRHNLNECVTKMREHRGKVDDYTAWVEVLESQGKSSLTLDQDDWLFFFSKNSAVRQGIDGKLSSRLGENDF